MPLPLFAQEDDKELFASIVAQAAKLLGKVGEAQLLVMPNRDDPRTAYNFSLPVAVQTTSFTDIVYQEYDVNGKAKVKTNLVVNKKEDDPVARKDIPKFISLASKYIFVWKYHISF